MKKSVFILVIIGIICVSLGIVIVGVTLVVYDFNMFNIQETEYTEVTHNIEGNFSEVELFTVECDVTFLPDDGGGSRVICSESENVTYTVVVENDVLKITRRDTTPWYGHIGFFAITEKNDITVYIPAGEYNAFEVTTTSGNIMLPSDFAIGDLTLVTVSGKLISNAAVSGNFTARTTSGDITLSNIAGKSLKVKTTSGKTKLTDSTTTDIDIYSVSGKIDLTNTVSSGDIVIDTTSGKVTLTLCDAANLDIKTTSGDITGSLLSEKHFITHAVSGDIDTPNNTSLSSECRVSTTSGDINFTIAQ